jgi:heme exporter protein A
MQHLTIESLSFERNDLPVFSNLSAQWPQGSLVQVLGQNGAGKTTLLRILAGLLKPTSGEVRWSGELLSSYAAQSELLYLGHEVGVDYSLTAEENLRWYFELNGTKSAGDASGELDVDTLLNKVGLKGYSSTLCRHMSAGQRRRVALARLYHSRAPLWVLDEPFTSIDAQGVESLSGCIREHVERGGLVVLSSHQFWTDTSVTYLELENYKSGFSWQ